MTCVRVVVDNMFLLLFLLVSIFVCVLKPVPNRWLTNFVIFWLSASITGHHSFEQKKSRNNDKHAGPSGVDVATANGREIILGAARKCPSRIYVEQ